MKAAVDGNNYIISMCVWIYLYIFRGKMETAMDSNIQKYSIYLDDQLFILIFETKEIKYEIRHQSFWCT